MENNNLINRDDLSAILSSYSRTGTSFKITGFRETNMETFGVNSAVYLISDIVRDNTVFWPYDIIVKKYFTREDAKGKKNGPVILSPRITYESEKAFYRFANNHLVLRVGGEDARVVPVCLNLNLPLENPTRTKLDNNRTLVLQAYERRGIIDRIKEIAQIRDGHTDIEDVMPFLSPLFMLWEEATAHMDQLGVGLPAPTELGRDEANEFRIYRPTSATYKRRNVGYVLYILKSMDVDISDEEREQYMNDVAVLAPYISAEGREGLESVIHGDCTPRNHLGRVLIDPSSFRISAWPLDLAYLLKNPYFDGLGLDDKTLIEACVEGVNNVRKTFVREPKKIRVSEALKSLYICGFHGAVRNFGIDEMKLKERQAYKDFVKRNPEYLRGLQQHLANARTYLEKLSALNLTPDEGRAVEGIIRLGDRLGLFRSPEGNGGQSRRTLRTSPEPTSHLAMAGAEN